MFIIGIKYANNRHSGVLCTLQLANLPYKHGPFIVMVQWFDGLFLPLNIKKYIIIYNVHRIKGKKVARRTIKDHKAYARWSSSKHK